jgi:hypothetical protein
VVIRGKSAHTDSPPLSILQKLVLEQVFFLTRIGKDILIGVDKSTDITKKQSWIVSEFFSERDDHKNGDDQTESYIPFCLQKIV